MTLAKWVREVPKRSNYTTTFGGLNRTEHYSEGEMESGFAVSSSRYPCIYPIEMRSRGTVNCNDIFSYDGEAYISRGSIYKLPEDPSESYELVSSNGFWSDRYQFVTINSKIINIPSMEFFDFSDKTECDLRRMFVINGTADGNKIVGAKAKGIVENYKGKKENINKNVYFWFTNKNLDDSLDLFNGSTFGESYKGILKLGSSVSVGDVFVPVFPDGYEGYLTMPANMTGIEANRNGWVGVVTAINDSEDGSDMVEITSDYYCVSDIPDDPNLKKLEVGSVLSFTVNYKTDEYKVTKIEGNTVTFDKDIPATSQTSFVATRKIPDLDFAVSLNNRIYGVSNADKTIYVSALGLPSVFYDYSSDTAGSYSVAVGSGGDFTAAVAYNNSVYFFKEDIVHKLIGSYPSDFYMTDYTIDGIQKGSHKSAVEINGVLYYQGKRGVYTFTGSYPQLLSHNLGSVFMRDAVAFNHNGNYLISVKEGSEGTDMTYLYDTLHGVWTPYDHVYFHSFVKAKYMGEYRTVGIVYEDNILGHDYYRPFYLGTTSNVIDLPTWEFVLKPFYNSQTSNGASYPLLNRKGVTKLILRADMELNSKFDIWIKEDDGEWKLVKSESREGHREFIYDDKGHIIGSEIVYNNPDYTKTLSIPIRIGRCDKFQVKVNGKGYCLFRTMYREYSVGSMR